MSRSRNGPFFLKKKKKRTPTLNTSWAHTHALCSLPWLRPGSPSGLHISPILSRPLAVDYQRRLRGVVGKRQALPTACTNCTQTDFFSVPPLLMYLPPPNTHHNPTNPPQPPHPSQPQPPPMHAQPELQAPSWRPPAGRERRRLAWGIHRGASTCGTRDQRSRPTSAR